MIGDDYIEQRAELGTALYVLATLARDAGVQLDVRELLHQLHRALRDPFLFVVVGEVKAGKSTLLNALFGREFCKASVLPTTDRIAVFKYGAQERDIPVADSVVECERPIGFLQDFQIVDTPGTNTIAAGHEMITNRYLPMADLVLFVFSITNPWGASAWEFLHHVQKTWLKHVAFVVQQIDLREPMEVEAVVDHLKQTALERLGRECPIFAVSAKSAFLAKTTAIDKERLWKESRFEALENYINNTVSDGENRRGKLAATATSGKGLLEQLRGEIERLHHAAREDRGQMEALSRTMVWMREQTGRQIDGLLHRVGEAARKAEENGAATLGQSLGPGRTLSLAFSHARWTTQFTADWESERRRDIQAQIEAGLGQLQEELDHVWEQLTAAMEEGLSGQDLFAPPQLPESFRLKQKVLTEKISHRLAEANADAGLGDRLKSGLLQATLWIRMTLVALLAGVGAAVGHFAAHLPGMDLAALGAGFTAVVGLLVTLGKRRQVIEGFHGAMSEQRARTLAIVEEEFQQLVKQAYQDFGENLKPLARRCEERVSRFDPIAERFAQLSKTFDRLLARLGPIPDPPVGA